MTNNSLHIRKGHKGFVAVDPDIRFWAKVQKSDGDGCWNWMGAIRANGYGQFYSGVRLCPAHRWIYEHQFGKQPKDIHICHHCDNRRCVRPDHLFAGTRSDNMRDCSAKGRIFLQIHPELAIRCRKPKLTADHVREMRSLRATGVTAKILAIKFRISEGYCFRVLSGKTKAKSWANI